MSTTLVFTQALYSQISISRSWWDYLYKFKLPEVQINLQTCKKVSNTNNGWRKQSKCIFDSDSRFEFRRIRHIRVRDIEVRLYKTFNNLPGKCERYLEAGDHCDDIDVMNGHCGCASGLGCGFVPATTTTAHLVRRGPPFMPGPGAYRCKQK